jgi:DnaJ-class molecular chaperone
MLGRVIGRPHCLRFLALPRPRVNWESENLYERLGVDHTATSAEIKAAHRELTRAYHPDTHTDSHDKELGSKVLSAVNSAYDILKDDQQRAEYDYQLPAHLKRSPDIFHKVLHLSFADGAFGCVKSLSIPTTKQCTICRGHGTHDQPPAFPCLVCPGRGRMATIALEIPPGICDGAIISVAAPFGAVVVLCDIESDPIVARDGNDLHVVIPISPRTAALGSVIRVPTLSGVITHNVEPATRQNAAETLHGLGVNGRGDLIIHYRIVDEAEERWNQLVDAFQARISSYIAK